ncbi:hypothetical protein [Demequina sediminicola]|uniref:hypothetical protein n=1 Tax=Demequina sediminicola TaxID=1095026 RepID=UPI000B004C23|nr:hypothetical protein [Demequina sediminicola]
MNEERRLSKADRVGMYMSVGLVVVGAVMAIIDAVRRLKAVGDGTNVPVQVPLIGETASLPLGPDGAPVTATVDTATVIVANPAAATEFALYAQPIWQALFVCAGLVVAAIFFLRVARGHAFSRGAVRLVYGAVAIVAVGWVGTSILTNMTTNGALSAISEYTYDSILFEVSLTPMLGILLLGAVAGALDIGERLQRDTEGLV